MTLDRMKITKRVGKGAGGKVIRIGPEAHLMELQPGDIIEVDLTVIQRAGRIVTHPDREI